MPNLIDAPNFSAYRTMEERLSVAWKPEVADPFPKPPIPSLPLPRRTRGVLTGLAIGVVGALLVPFTAGVIYAQEPSPTQTPDNPGITWQAPDELMARYQQGSQLRQPFQITGFDYPPTVEIQASVVGEDTRRSPVLSSPIGLVDFDAHNQNGQNFDVLGQQDEQLGVIDQPSDDVSSNDSQAKIDAGLESCLVDRKCTPKDGMEIARDSFIVRITGPEPPSSEQIRNQGIEARRDEWLDSQRADMVNRLNLAAQDTLQQLDRLTKSGQVTRYATLLPYWLLVNTSPDAAWQTAATLAGIKEVAGIIPNTRYRLNFDGPIGAAFQQEPYPGWNIDRVRAYQAIESFAVDGGTRTVAIMDLIPNYAHYLLSSTFLGYDSAGNRIDNFRCAIYYVDPFSQTGDHGTHVAGISSGGSINDGSEYDGVKIGVSNAGWIAVGPIVGGFISLGDFGLAVEQLIYPVDQNGQFCEERFMSDAVNMSFELNPRAQEVDFITSQLQMLRAAAIVPIAAAGNSGKSGVSYPAKLDEAIAVGNTDSEDNVHPYSSVGPEVDICAPGTSVWSAVGSYGIDVKSGTSMAAPHITGLVPLLIEYAQKNGFDITPAQLEQFIFAGATDIGLSPEQCGAGRTDFINSLVLLREYLGKFRYRLFLPLVFSS